MSGEEEEKVTYIQTWWRMVTVQALASAQKSATVKLQAAVRGIVTRRTIRAITAAAAVIQAHARGRRARDDLSRRRAAAVRMQVAVRVVSASARVARMREEHRRQLAAVTIQNTVRGAVARTTRRAMAAIMMQR